MHFIKISDFDYFLFSLVANGQVVLMSLESETSYVGDHTALSCSYVILDSSYLVFTLSWFKGDSPLDPSIKKIADFIREETSPYYGNGYDDQSRYKVSRSGNSGSFISTFDIFNVEFSRDRGRYLCSVTVIRFDGTNFFDTVDSTDLIVYSKYTTIIKINFKQFSFFQHYKNMALLCLIYVWWV